MFRSKASRVREKRFGPALFLFVFFGLALPRAWGQEKFNDVRQSMADRLTEVKTAVRTADRTAARVNLDKARQIWETEVWPMIAEGVQTNDQFAEYFDRRQEIETNLNVLASELDAGASDRIESLVNATIWSISHHPRGFGVPRPRYTVWDWVFALTIGIGFCVFAVVFGLYLRRSYYRRYASYEPPAPRHEKG